MIGIVVSIQVAVKLKKFRRVAENLAEVTRNKKLTACKFCFSRDFLDLEFC